MIIATLHRTSSPFASTSKSDSKAKFRRPISSDKGKSKVIVISDSESESESDAPENAPEAQREPIGWGYVGSHNFTPSAWGTLSGSAFNPTLNVGFVLKYNTTPTDFRPAFILMKQVVNYELGIVFPLYEEDVKRVSCFKRPPRKYVLGEDRPWVSSFFYATFSI